MAHLHILAGIQERPARPSVRKLELRAVRDSLVEGARDFCAAPSHLAFICLLYPVAGVCLAALTSTQNDLYLLYPLLSGFAIVGPVAAIGVYELSRRLEAGRRSEWTDAFGALRSPAILSIIALGALLAALLVAWLATASGLYHWLYGDAPPAHFGQFLRELFTTQRGWTLLLVGNAAGFCYAAVALAISVVSFPLLLDRDVGAAVAVETSLRATIKNPVVVAAFGLVVAIGLAGGLALAFVGLVIVLPVLGHATWRLYRRMIGPDEA